jgi:hypothetical protein
MKVQLIGTKPKAAVTLPDSFAMRLIEQGKAVPVRPEAIKQSARKGKAKQSEKAGE